MTIESREINEELRRRASRVRLLALDSDGVLTDGGVYVTDDGHEFRRFNIKDGQGLKRVMSTGVEVVIISASTSKPIIQRAADLGIDRVYIVGVKDKLLQLNMLCEALTIEFALVAYMGDSYDQYPDL